MANKQLPELGTGCFLNPADGASIRCPSAQLCRLLLPSCRPLAEWDLPAAGPRWDRLCQSIHQLGLGIFLVFVNKSVSSLHFMEMSSKIQAIAKYRIASFALSATSHFHRLWIPLPLLSCFLSRMTTGRQDGGVCGGVAAESPGSMAVPLPLLVLAPQLGLCWCSRMPIQGGGLSAPRPPPAHHLAASPPTPREAHLKAHKAHGVGVGVLRYSKKGGSDCLPFSLHWEGTAVTPSWKRPGCKGREGKEVVGL